MDQLLKDCWKLRQQCSEYDKLSPGSSSELNIPDACFAMIFNQATLTLELLDKYFGLWRNALPTMSQQEIERQRRENAERCTSITKQLYVSSISSIEFSIRRLIAARDDHPLAECVRRREKLITTFDLAYNSLEPMAQAKIKSFRKALKDVPPFDSFWRIVERSCSLGYLSEAEAELWKFCLRLRNCAVHNNAIADQDAQIIIQSRTFEMKSDAMTRGKLDIFTFLLAQLVESLKTWFQKLEVAY